MTDSPRATFTLDYTTKFTLTEDTPRIIFGEGIEVPVKLRKDFDLELDKKAEVNQETGVITYTVTVKADGDASNFQIRDTMGDALKLLTTSPVSVSYAHETTDDDGTVVSTNVNTQYQSNNMTVTQTENGFEASFVRLKEGDVATLTYQARVKDFNLLGRQPDGTDHSANSVCSVINGEAKSPKSVSLEGKLKYLSITKTHGTAQQNTDGGSISTR